jgi:branched-chain amino acid transport system substrate-binding protein
VRGIQAANPDLVFVASYPPDTVGIIRAASEIGLKAKLFGGGMVGLQSTAIKTQLGPLMNGIVDYDVWQPVPPFNTPEAMDFLARYQAKSARRESCLGFTAAVRLCRQPRSCNRRSRASKSRSAETRDFLRSHTAFKTVAGDIAFGRAASGPMRGYWRCSSRT